MLSKKIMYDFLRHFLNPLFIRLLLYKYDWIEVNPGLSAKERKNVPWNDLLAKDRKLLGPRTLKGFFFPWKENKA